MNESQKKRAERFEAMKKNQAERAVARKDSRVHRANVIKGKTPGGPRHKTGNQRIRFVGDQLFQGGTYVVEHLRDGKVIDKRTIKNGIVNEGLNNNLSVAFNAGTQITNWYMGLIDNAGFTALASDDTYDDINQAGNGWDEFTDYTDANNADSATTRPEWPTDAPSGQSISNTTQGIYDITGSGTVRGIFVVGGGTDPELKGDHAPGSTLWSTAPFTGGNVVVTNGDQLKVTYTVNASTT